jgi:hypothetical protein
MIEEHPKGRNATLIFVKGIVSRDEDIVLKIKKIFNG